MSSSAAKKLVGKVNVRMAKAADATAGASDPMRAAVSLALFQAPQPPNSMAAAKVRLRLYAGLNEWALEAIFAPQPGVIAGCVREVGASQSECEALVAAAARSSVAQIRPVAGGSAQAAAPAGYAAQGAAPAAAGGGRFQRFSSGYAPAAAPAAAPRYGAPAYPQQPYPQQQYQQPRYGAPAYGAQPAYGYQQPQAPRYPQQNYAPPQQYQAQRYPQQGYQPQQYQRPVAAAPVAPPPPPQPVVSAQELQSRKEAYKAQREAYLARQKQQFEERKNKAGAVLAADASEAPPRNGVETPAVAAPASKPAAASTATASAAKPAAKPSGGSALDDEPSEPVAAKSGGGKPALDNDFLDGLLDDPLANKNKK